VTAAPDSHYCTCLGNLGSHDTNKNGPIPVVLPKVAKATMKAKMSAISQHDITHVFACKLQTLQMHKSLKVV
jgi:hypothetical protein